MLKSLAAIGLALLPCAALAAPAPSNCADNFFTGEMPDVGEAHAATTRLLCFSEYADLHSGLTKTPVWSAEHLTGERIDAASHLKRKNPFHAESSLPADQRAELSDYKGSGYDRGHMSPNGDMSTEKAQRESFSLANMIPQDPCSNEELWEGIESAVRELVTQEDEAFVVTGPIYSSDAGIKQIGNGVLVPTSMFKAVYVPSQNAAGAYVAPNTPAKDFKVISITDLKTLTDIDAFPKLPPDVKTTAMELPPPKAPQFHCRVSTHN
jgi:endonuclease G